MPDAFNIDLSDFNGLADRLKDLPDRLVQLVDAELADGCEAIAAEAKQRAPADDGILRTTIGVDKLAPMQYNVFSNALYSAYVEFGTRANVSIPPGLEDYAAQFMGPSSSTSSLGAKEAIFNWCEHKGIEKSAWYAIFITIMTKGGQPHPFFFPAVNRILPIIVNRVLRVLVSDAFSDL